MPLIQKMIVEFATFERMADEVSITKEALLRDGFGAERRFGCMIALWQGKPAGYAIYFNFYSSFQGPGLFLEDVYVRDEFRGKGVGKALMAEVAAIALRAGFWAMRWEVLDWNQPAIDFYKKLGATFLDDWKAVLLEGEHLRRLAEKVNR